MQNSGPFIVKTGTRQVQERADAVTQVSRNLRRWEVQEDRSQRKREAKLSRNVSSLQGVNALDSETDGRTVRRITRTT